MTRMAQRLQGPSFPHLPLLRAAERRALEVEREALLAKLRRMPPGTPYRRDHEARLLRLTTRLLQLELKASP